MDSSGKHYNIDDTLNSLVDQGSNLAKSNFENFLTGHRCLNGVCINLINKNCRKNIKHFSFFVNLQLYKYIVKLILSSFFILQGNGWWKYEFCYGRAVTQYHIETGGSKTVLNLGEFNKGTHMAWVDADPAKRKPKPVGQRKQISHFYSHGTACDKTGKLRQTEV